MFGKRESALDTWRGTKSGWRYRYGSLTQLLRHEQFESRICLSFEPTSVFAADLDGDGDMDVLYAYDGLTWRENTDGQGSFGQPQRLECARTSVAHTPVPFSVHAADMDGDGDVDALCSGNREIGWYENTDGQGSFGEQQVIDRAARRRWLAIHAADIDGDGDMDVLSASFLFSDDGSKIAWYENTDGIGSFSEQKIITTAVARAWSVYAADVDGDGDMDVLSASRSDDKIAWYENTDGNGSFSEQKIITTAADGAQSVCAADVDGDGDMDVLSASWGDDKIAWYENTDGQGRFGQQRIISTKARGAKLVRVADVDGDGDVDVLSASSGIAWYENTDGTGSFGDQHVITGGLTPSMVFPTDVDGDGDVDVIAANWYDVGRWFENLSPQTAAGDANSDLQFDRQDIEQVLQAGKYLTEEPATFEEGDWNGDGVFDQQDIVAALQTGNYLKGPYAKRASDALFATEGQWFF